MWLPMVVHSAPLMTPMFLTERMVKNKSLSALSFQFLFMLPKPPDPAGSRSMGTSSSVEDRWMLLSPELDQ